MSYFGGNDLSSDDENEENEKKEEEEEDDDESIIGEQELGEEVGDAEMDGGGGEIDDDEMIIEDADEEGDDTEYVDEGEEGEGEGEGEGEDEDDDENKQKKSKKLPTKNIYKKPDDYINDDEEDENDDEDGEEYLQKFDQTINENYVLNYHPETVLHNYDEIEAMTKVTRNPDGIIIDKLHRTIPYLTKYEKARILGQRAKQINAGAYPLVKVPENVIDGLIIAELELKQKRIPFIIRRPLPNGGSEYWKVKDLEDISF
jgi:DNA-directed RNA polymerase I, II, and III subunit RPABC2